MTEKEFLVSYIEHCYKTYNPWAIEHPDYQDRLNESADLFLEEHHKEYFEVDFVKNSQADIDHERECKLCFPDD